MNATDATTFSSSENLTHLIDMNATEATTFTTSESLSHLIDMLTDEGLQKSANGIFLGIIILGIPFNVIAACIWMFGRRSKELCSATYFASNAVADFLCLAVPGISTYLLTADFFKYVYASIITRYTTDVLLALTNWISVSITVERALTMLCPFVFRHQGMRRRSKYVVLAICVLLLSTYVPLKDFGSNVHWLNVELFDLSVRVVVPFILIVVINTAVVAILCKRRFQQDTVSTNRKKLCGSFHENNLINRLVIYIVKYRWCYRFYGQL